MSNRKHTITKNLYVPKTNNSICEALNCYKNATLKINISAGICGAISLNLCHNCVNLFKEEAIN